MLEEVSCYPDTEKDKALTLKSNLQSLFSSALLCALEIPTSEYIFAIFWPGFMNYLLEVFQATRRHACRGCLSPRGEVRFLCPLKSAVSFHGVTSASVASVMKTLHGRKADGVSRAWELTKGHETELTYLQGTATPGPPQRVKWR